MAVIQKIRDKYAKLAGFIIALALVGFLLMDAGDNLKKIFSGDEYIANVDGDKIDPRDYSLRIQEYETLYELMGNRIDDNTRAQIHDQVLREMIYERLIADDVEDLGLTVTKEEEKEMISGSNPDPLVMQFPYFKNPETGQFDPQALMNFETNKLDMSNPQAQKAMEQWQTMKNYIKRSRLTQKYNSMFMAAAFTPKFISDRQTADQNYMASVRYVKIPFTTVNDNEVKVTDEDLKKYMERHAAQYRIEDPTRSIDYVSFDVVPSKEDTAAVLTSITQLRTELTTTGDVESFINRNSEEQYKDMFVSKKTFMSAYSDSIMNLPVGAVYGPYFENGSYHLVRIMEKRSLPDSAKAQHILIAINQTRDDSSAKKTADSLKLAIQSGAPFDSLAVKFSEDPGSKDKGGDLGYFSYGAMVPEFNDAVFLGKPGDLSVVKTQFGYHVIKVTDQRNFAPAVKLASLTKTLAPSPETESAAYAKANEFAGRNTTPAAFDEAVKKQGINKLQAQNVKVNDFVMPGLGSAREIIRWMYESDKGEISPVFTLDGRFVIAKLTDVQEEGMMQLDATNRPMLESLVKAEKKAEKIANLYKGKGSVDAIAQASAQPVQQVDSFNASSAYLPGLGYEPRVVGYAFFEGFKENATSPAIKGQDGVFFISLKQRYRNPTTGQVPMLQQQMDMQTMQLKNAIASMLQETMRRDADIKYSVKNLY